MRASIAVLVGVLASFAAPAHADLSERPPDIEVPALVLDASAGPVDDSLELANIVLSAAKGVVTVQEAPAIVTVVTRDELVGYNYRTIIDVVDGIPGWMRVDTNYGQFPYAMARGTVQGTLFMHNGVSLFDPFSNVPVLWRTQPVEMIQRVEVVTGPGGVLWGANSFLGLINVVTRGPDDVNGVEAQVLVGDGPGDRGVARAYVMAGASNIAGTKLGALLHVSIESYEGPEKSLPSLLFFNPPPQPNSLANYGPLTTSDTPRSTLFNLNGKLEFGDLELFVMAPIAESHTPLSLSGFVTREQLPEDELRTPAGELECPNEPPYVDTSDRCLDKGRRNRDNRLNWFDRYVIARYQTRFADGSAGLNVKAYATQFVREFAHLGLFSPLPGQLEGGLAFSADATSYRAGGTFDGDFAPTNNVRVLYGFESFHEWVPDSIDRSRQGAGVEVVFPAPYELERLPVPCPLTLDDAGNAVIIDGCPITFLFETSRTVLASYLNPQWRPIKRLILDGGVRVQGAPKALGALGYSPELLVSGAIVYNLLEGWWTKLNYAEGIRPPVFNNTNSNGEAVQFDGRTDLVVETSQAVQAEVNARLYRGSDKLRELAFRADYSLTHLENTITITGNRYENSGPRAIHSAELLARLFLHGNHRVDLGYTWLRVDTSDRGRFRSLPEHWISLRGQFAMFSSLLGVTSLRIVGAQEDPNRIVEFRDLSYDEAGFPEMRIVQPHELVLDRLPPSAELRLGLHWTPTEQLRVSAFAENVFDALNYHSDIFNDYEPRLYTVPNPGDYRRFTLSATWAP